MVNELSLVSIEDLVDEIFKRKEATIIAYLDVDNGERIIKTQWSGDFILTNGLANVLGKEVAAIGDDEDDDED